MNVTFGTAPDYRGLSHSRMTAAMEALSDFAYKRLGILRRRVGDGGTVQPDEPGCRGAAQLLQCSPGSVYRLLDELTAAGFVRWAHSRRGQIIVTVLPPPRPRADQPDLICPRADQPSMSPAIVPPLTLMPQTPSVPVDPSDHAVIALPIHAHDHDQQASEQAARARENDVPQPSPQPQPRVVMPQTSRIRAEARDQGADRQASEQAARMRENDVPQPSPQPQPRVVMPQTSRIRAEARDQGADRQAREQAARMRGRVSNTRPSQPQPSALQPPLLPRDQDTIAPSQDQRAGELAARVGLNSTPLQPHPDPATLRALTARGIYPGLARQMLAAHPDLTVAEFDAAVTRLAARGRYAQPIFVAAKIFARGETIPEEICDVEQPPQPSSAAPRRGEPQPSRHAGAPPRRRGERPVSPERAAWAAAELARIEQELADMPDLP